MLNQSNMTGCTTIVIHFNRLDFFIGFHCDGAVWDQDVVYALYCKIGVSEWTAIDNKETTDLILPFFIQNCKWFRFPHWINTGLGSIFVAITYYSTVSNWANITLPIFYHSHGPLSFFHGNLPKISI